MLASLHYQKKQSTIHMVCMARWYQLMFIIRSIRQRRWVLCLEFTPPPACSTSMKHLCDVAEELTQVADGMLTNFVLAFTTMHKPFLVTVVMLTVADPTLIKWATLSVLVVFRPNREYHDYFLFELRITSPFSCCHSQFPTGSLHEILEWPVTDCTLHWTQYPSTSTM